MTIAFDDLGLFDERGYTFDGDVIGVEHGAAGGGGFDRPGMVSNGEPATQAALDNTSKVSGPDQGRTP